MGLELILGPANAGKVADLYARYLAALDAGHEALLVVPGRSAVVRAERDLLARRRAVVGSLVATFDDVFRRVATLAGDGRRVLPPGTRTALLRRLANDRAGVPADALPALIDRLGSARVDPAALAASDPGPLADAYAAWWRELDRVGAVDLARLRLEACRLLEGSLEAWDGALLFVEGFEDLSVAQEALVRLVGARSGATMTLPYEPGRPAFAALAELVGRLADAPGTTVVERPAVAVGRAPALAAWERRLFQDAPSSAPPGDADVLVLEAAGARAEAELVLDAVLRALRTGVAPGEILIVTAHDPVASEIGDALRAAACRCTSRDADRCRGPRSAPRSPPCCGRRGIPSRSAPTCSSSCARPGRGCPDGAWTRPRRGCAGAASAVPRRSRLRSPRAWAPRSARSCACAAPTTSWRP